MKPVICSLSSVTHAGKNMKAVAAWNVSRSFTCRRRSKRRSGGESIKDAMCSINPNHAFARSWDKESEKQSESGEGSILIFVSRFRIDNRPVYSQRSEKAYSLCPVDLPVLYG